MDDRCTSPPFANSWSRWFFTISILFALYGVYRLVQPFLIPIFLSVVLVVVAGPVYDFIVKRVGQRRALASALTCLLLIVVLAVPFFLMAGLITSQAFHLYNTVSELLTSQQLQDTFREGLGRLAPQYHKLQEALGISQDEILKHVGEAVRRISGFLYSNLTSLLAGMTNLLIGFALVVFVTFYLLMDGEVMMEKALSLSPLPREMNLQIKGDILRSLRATLKGSVVLALINGTAGGLGFWIFGVPNALFWGTVMVFASVVPLVGTALVWVPGCVYLVVAGQSGQALGTALWCLVSSLTCDNVLRPRLIGGQTNLHPLLTFFSILGGLSLFGMVGLILGPLILAILLSLLEVYQRYFLENPAPRPEPEGQGEEPEA